MKDCFARLIFALLAAGFSCASQAVTVTFDSQKTNVAYAPVGNGTSYTESGFTFTSSAVNGLTTWGVADARNADPAGATLFENPLHSSISISQADGNPFSLVSLGVADIFSRAIPYIFPYTYTTAAGIFDGEFAVPATAGLASFDANLKGIISFTFYSSFQIDNVVLAPVPEPEAPAMLAAGLAVLGLVARRRKRQARKTSG